MKNIQHQLLEFTNKYSVYIRLLVNNMRLVLLIAFSIMSGYLVHRVNSLVNQEIIIAPSSETSSSTAKRPDKNVLSIFNELSVQDVELESDFESNRQNPF